MSGICIVLLAAGNASRYGSAKLLEAFDGQTLLRRIAGAALDTGSQVLVVTGSSVELIEHALAGLDVMTVHNPAWNDGMGTSIATAFKRLLADRALCTGAIVCPADLPLVGAEQFRHLIEAHRRRPAAIVASTWGEAQGAPCLFPSSYFDELAQLGGPQGARALLTKYRSILECIPMPEAATDIDTVEDYARLQARTPRPAS